MMVFMYCLCIIGAAKTVRYTELRGVRYSGVGLSIEVSGKTVGNFGIVLYIVGVH